MTPPSMAAYPALRSVTPATPFRMLFLFCAWAHLLVGMGGLVLLPAVFRPLGVPQPRVPFFWQLGAATTACFGLAGFWIARAPRRNRDLIHLWLCVKAAAVVLAIWSLRLHGVRPAVGVFVAVDIAWIGLFTSVLVRLGPGPPAP